MSDYSVELIKRERIRREQARRHYSKYLEYVHGATWKRTKMSQYLAEQVQAFIETDTGNAYDILLIECPPQHGKLCADSTPVPTPDGWVRHGDLRPGDYVFGPAGQPVKVLAEIPQSEPASLLVSFTDGASVKVHPRHEWVVYDRKNRHGNCVIETQEMLKLGLHMGDLGRGGRYRFSVEPNVLVEYPEQCLPVHPYFLGLWLGDGSTTKPCITHSPKDTAPIEKLKRLGYEPSACSVHLKTGVLTTYYSGETSAAFRSLDFAHNGGAVKHIPDIYKFASVRQRLELLAGMVDSDGYVYQRNGRVCISNINKWLIDDFTDVCRSLGWRATISEAMPVMSTSGIEAKHVCYQLTFSPDIEIPTALDRKKIAKTNPAKRRRGIKSIEPCEPESGKCITVEGGVYLVGFNFIPTHNSMTITETLPSWYLGKYPYNRIIEASYNDDTAKRFGRKTLDKVRSFGPTIFGIQPGLVANTTDLELKNKWGAMISRGIMSGITGNPANLLIIDDPIKNREEADSPRSRETLWEEWQSTLKSRLAAKAKVIVIMTPWHEDDFAARLAKTEPNLRLIRLPVEAEEGDALGRAVGDPLCPELGKDSEWLQQFKSSYICDPKYGLRAWQALYQCRPRIEEGNLIKREWWKSYSRKDIDYFPSSVISVDATFKDKDDDDFVAITVWGKRGVDYYLRYCLNRHLDFPHTVQAIQTVQQLYPDALYVLIEDKANGSAIIQTLQKIMIGVISVNPRGGKVARVNAISPAIESGHVFLPDDEAWADEFKDQFAAFPNGKHDDIVDSTSQALGYMLFSTGDYLPPVVDSGQKMLESAERNILDGDIYDVYGDDGSFYTG